MSTSEFFKNKDGKVVIIQPPNVLISSWAILQIINLIVRSSEIAVLATAVLFAWAYLELTQGESPFRKTLGGLVLLVIVALIFVR